MGKVVVGSGPCKTRDGKIWKVKPRPGNYYLQTGLLLTIAWADNSTLLSMIRPAFDHSGPSEPRDRCG